VNDTPEAPEDTDENPPVYSGPSISITDEMKTSYLDYAMSVIVSRAIPDVRDGLKPVHRRILYHMYDGGYTPDKSYRKCAKPVGEVMGTITRMVIARSMTPSCEWRRIFRCHCR